MYFRKVIAIATLLINTLIGSAQNLVPNPSFEDTVSCPTSISQLNNCSIWHNPTQASPDYFNSCSTANGGVVHTPDNAFGLQAPKSGSAYAGFYTGGPTNGLDNREYVQSVLSSPLNGGTTYYISFYVNLSNQARYAISKLGAFLSVGAPWRSDTKVINYVPQIVNTSGFITDTLNWVNISGYYLAFGGEQYITIGNFQADSMKDTLYINHGIYGFSAGYYYIDDVTVIDSASVGVRIYGENDKSLFVYPNPASSVLNIETDQKSGLIRIFDALGNEFENQKLPINKQITIDLLPPGVYFLQLINATQTSCIRFIKE